MKKKTLQELTIKDNFMFGAVMIKDDNCRELLEMILGFPIERIEIDKEKSIVYHPAYKGVRLDIFAKGENNTHYNVEMQAISKKAIGRRARYYHSQIDMEMLLSGSYYTQLANSYVIFICDFDPFGHKKYCYTFENACKEISEAALNDGSISIFLSTRGDNEKEVSKELVNFLKYVKADLKDSTANFNDRYVAKIQEDVRQIKQNREMGERYMLLQELIDDERAEAEAKGRAEGEVKGRAEGEVKGRIESIIDLLGDLGAIPENIRNKILQENNPDILKHWLKLVSKSDTIDHFIENM